MMELTIKDGIMLGFGFIIAQVIVAIPVAFLYSYTNWETERQVLNKIRETLYRIEIKLADKVCNPLDPCCDSCGDP